MIEKPSAANVCNPQQHFSRRSLLRAGGGGLLLQAIAGRLAAAPPQAGSAARQRSVILLWMEGAPSQLETFDPHPGNRYGGQTRAIRTSARDVQISHLLPQTAAQMHRAALIRSVTGQEGDHTRAVYNIKTGYRLDPTLVHPSLGAVVCHQSEGGAEIPRHISILPGQRPARGGYLGAEYDAFQVRDPALPVPDVSPRVDDPRFDRRLDDLLDVVEPAFARGRLPDLDRSRTLHQTATAAAVTMMSSPQLEAFDVSQEPAEVRRGFGDTPFGRGCLAAARLVEVGVHCVEVTLGGWDSHFNNHALQTAACASLDPALAALLQRLADRDLLDSTLVVCGGEFGRTPAINAAGGRDHWPHGFSTLLAGCGIRGGAVHGATAADPRLDTDQPLRNVQDPVTVADVHATMLKTLGIDPSLELQTPVGRPMRLCEGEPIAGVLA